MKTETTPTTGRRFFGAGLMTVMTSLSVFGFQSHAITSVEGFVTGIGFMLMVWP